MWFQSFGIFLIKLLFHISFLHHGHSLWHLDHLDPFPVERKTISNPNPKKILISGRIGVHNPDPVHNWCAQERITNKKAKIHWQWRTQKIFMRGVWLWVIWWSFVFGVRCLWRHKLTSFSCFQTNVLAKFVDIIMHIFLHQLPLFHMSLHWI